MYMYMCNILIIIYIYIACECLYYGYDRVSFILMARSYFKGCKPHCMRTATC